jgi:hypothetical protein
MIPQRYVTIVDSLYQYYNGHCPLSEVYWIYKTFWQLALPLPLGMFVNILKNFIFSHFKINVCGWD